MVLLSAHPTGDDGKTFIQDLIKHYATELNVAEPFSVSQGTVICPRVDSQGKQLWVIVNMDGNGGTVTLPAKTRDALTGQALTTSNLSLKPYEWRVLNV